MRYLILLAALWGCGGEIVAAPLESQATVVNLSVVNEGCPVQLLAWIHYSDQPAELVWSGAVQDSLSESFLVDDSAVRMDWRAVVQARDPLGFIVEGTVSLPGDVALRFTQPGCFK